MFPCTRTLLFVDGRLRSMKLFHMPVDHDVTATCPRCKSTDGRWVLDIVRYGFWYDDIVSVWRCDKGHYCAYQAAYQNGNGAGMEIPF
jgi:hypothetical protein